jgi:hypothetical protein
MKIVEEIMKKKSKPLTFLASHEAGIGPLVVELLAKTFQSCRSQEQAQRDNYYYNYNSYL